MTVLARCTLMPHRPYSADGSEPRLTPDEIRVLEVLMTGRAVAEAATCLGLSTAALQAHLDEAQVKLHATSKVEAIVQALRLGYCELPPA
jgi:DNA-binding NarL/FixJ family response regulator